MKNLKQKLIIEQVDKKLKLFRELEPLSIPESGWIRTIRLALKMSLKQFAKKLNITSQSAGEIEQREAKGSITLNALKEAAFALDMKLVYGLIPKEESIEKMIEKRALEIATEIVERTSTSMKLEGQENSRSRLYSSIKNKAAQIAEEMPKYLWD